MGKISFFSGIGLIALSGILFTVERFISVFQYASESFPVRLNGSGSFPSEPSMPGIFDNFFVGILLILGLVLLVFGTIKIFSDKR
ncbi:hypothetical protein PB01_14450 [Psychrobacillus glaciei]|uniref:Uncharacterized protein n=1 Tax=Psychrobacillus glaciei TaxID=2283160 RepID=A0A5J6SPQ8_9BACI|nr:hypothetical protein [Psychrobacillus glaciei]QFF99925.1 hypothetical protein PB01_14450 [Psychrobacillus glaciei]